MHVQQNTDPREFNQNTVSVGDFKWLNYYFEVILFKSYKDKSFFVSPEPECLRHRTGLYVTECMGSNEKCD